MRGRLRGLLVAAALLAAGGATVPAGAQLGPQDPSPAAVEPALAPAQPSRALGRPWAGRLEHGVQLPVRGEGFESYDQILHRIPNRPWRRWATQELVTVVEAVAASWAADHPDRTPLLVSDLSRPNGGWFGRQYGGLGHQSHQNGLDVDVMYPRKDGRRAAPRTPGDVDRRLAQELVDRFLEAGAVKLYVGPHLRLRGPRRIVVPLVHHDDHVHVRIPNPGSGR